MFLYLRYLNILLVMSYKFSSFHAQIFSILCNSCIAIGEIVMFKDIPLLRNFFDFSDLISFNIEQLNGALTFKVDYLTYFLKIFLI